MCTLKSEHLVKRSRSVAITEEGKDNQQIVTSILMDPFQRQSVKRSTSVAITDLLLQSNQPTIASTVRHTLESYPFNNSTPVALIDKASFNAVKK